MYHNVKVSISGMFVTAVFVQLLPFFTNHLCLTGDTIGHC